MELTTLAVVVQILIVAAMGYADRLRGDDRDLFDRRVFDKVVYGALVAALFLPGVSMPSDAPAPVIATVAFVALIVIGMMAGMSPGWGNAVGPALRGHRPDPDHAEWWQRGVLLRSAWAALAARGALWGLALAPAAIIDPRALVAIPAYTLAMPLAVYITNWQREPYNGDWQDQERYRGWLAGGLMLIGLWVM